MSNKNLEKYRKLQKEFAKRRARFWKPEIGEKNTIRILPPVDDDAVFFEEVPFHFMPASGNDKAKSIQCLVEDCPVCKVVNKLRQGDESAQELADQVRKQVVFYMNIVDIKNPEAGVQIWKTYSSKVIDQLLGFIADSEYGDFTDIEEGRNIVVVGEQKGSAIQYTCTPRPSVSSIDKPFLDDRRDLKGITPKSSKAEALSFAKSIAAASDVEMDEDFQKARKVLASTKRKTKPNKLPKKSYDEEEEDDDE